MGAVAIDVAADQEQRPFYNPQGPITNDLLPPAGLHSLLKFYYQLGTSITTPAFPGPSDLNHKVAISTFSSSQSGVND